MNRRACCICPASLQAPACRQRARYGFVRNEIPVAELSTREHAPAVTRAYRFGAPQTLACVAPLLPLTSRPDRVMMRPLLMRAGLQVVGRAGSSSCLVGAPRGPAPRCGGPTGAEQGQGGEWRRISSGGVRQVGEMLQQQVGAPRTEPFCSADSVAPTPGGGGGSRAASGSRAIIGAAQHKTNGAAHAANGHTSNGHVNCVNGVSHVHDVSSLCGGCAKEAAAPQEQHEHHHVDPRQRAREVILGGAAALQRLAATVDETFDQAVALIEGREKGSRVIVVGIGKSGHLARKLAATLSSTGTPASPLLSPASLF